MQNFLKIFGAILSPITSSKSFADNPLLGSPKLNRLGLHTARKRAAHMMCQVRRIIMAPKVTKAWRDDYQRQGFVRIQNFLPEKIFKEVKHELAKLAQQSIEMRQGSTITRRFNLDASNCRNLPSLQSILRHRELLWGLRYIAGYWGQPIIAVQCIHAEKDDSCQSRDPQTDWHLDTFHSTAKAWIFMHEVKTDEGPFAYVPGSHRPSKHRLAWEKEQSIYAAKHADRLHARGSFRVCPEDIQHLGYGQPMIGAVAENTLIVADTSGFHRRTPSPKNTVRVEIYMSLRRNPFWAGLYPSLLGLPYIKNHWASLAWGLYRWMDKIGRHSWQASTEEGLTAKELSKLDVPE